MGASGADGEKCRPGDDRRGSSYQRRFRPAIDTNAKEGAMRIKTHARGIVITALFTLAPGVWGWWPNQIKAQVVEVPQFTYDPFWPKPLPDGWVLGSVG